MALVTQQTWPTYFAKTLGLAVFSSIKEAGLAQWPKYELVPLKRPLGRFLENGLSAFSLPETKSWALVSSKFVAAIVLGLILVVMAGVIFPRAVIEYAPPLQEKMNQVNAQAAISNTDILASGQIPLRRKVVTVTQQGSRAISGQGETTSLPGVSRMDVDALKAALTEEVLANAAAFLEKALPAEDIVVPESIYVSEVDILGMAKGSGAKANLLFMVLTVDLTFDTISEMDVVNLGHQVLDLNRQEGGKILAQDVSFEIQDWQIAGSDGYLLQINYCWSYYLLINPQTAVSKISGLRPEAAREVLEGLEPDLRVLNYHITPSWFPWIPFIPYQVSLISTEEH